MSKGAVSHRRSCLRDHTTKITLKTTTPLTPHCNVQAAAMPEEGAHRKGVNVCHALERAMAARVAAAAHGLAELVVDHPLDVRGGKGEEVREAAVPRVERADTRRVLLQAQRHRLQQARRAVAERAVEEGGIAQARPVRLVRDERVLRERRGEELLEVGVRGRHGRPREAALVLLQQQPCTCAVDFVSLSTAGRRMQSRSEAGWRAPAVCCSSTVLSPSKVLKISWSERHAPKRLTAA